MAAKARAPKIGSPLTLTLRKLGCTYCELCKGFMYPDHTEHVIGAFDTHHSRYSIVRKFPKGGYNYGAPEYEIIETEAA